MAATKAPERGVAVALESTLTEMPPGCPVMIQEAGSVVVTVETSFVVTVVTMVTGVTDGVLPFSRTIDEPRPARNANAMTMTTVIAVASFLMPRRVRS